MKTLLTLLIFATVATCLAAPLSPAEQKVWMKGLETEMKSLRANLDGAVSANRDLHGELDTTKTSLLLSYQANEKSLATQTAVVKQMMELQSNLAAKDKEFGTVILERDQLKIDKAAEHAKYLRAKFFIGGVSGLMAAILVGLLILRHAGLALNTPAGAGALLVSVLVVFGLVFGAMQLLF